MSLFGKPSPKKEESKESPPRTGGGLFANQAQAQAQPTGTGGGLFATLAQAQPEQPTTGGRFGGINAGPITGGGLFGNASPPKQGGSLFGSGPPAQQGGGGLFANQGQAQPEQPTTGGLLGGGGGGQRTGGSLFGGGPPPRPGGGGGGLFGAKAQIQAQTQAQAQPAKPLNVHELQGNAPYNPNPAASNTRKEGTVNYDPKFGRSNENYDIFSITCASNADKNKSIEELRAEDYELIRSGELPEHLQLKLIENREKLEKSLGFALPVPTSTTASKNYTRVFKSQTRNASMKSSFLSNKYSDVTFKVEDESISAHRNVLGLCSQYFDNLFEKHESNTIPLVIEIHDAKPEAFKAILEFFYCGEVNLYEELAADLLILAPRFDLNDLATGAEDFLTKIINADNYLKMLETSDRIGSKSLRKKVFTFIIRNMKVISKREDFEELPRPLLMELLENAVTA
jgi:hypothetical protein